MEMERQSLMDELHVVSNEIDTTLDQERRLTPPEDDRKNILAVAEQFWILRKSKLKKSFIKLVPTQKSWINLWKIIYPEYSVKKIRKIMRICLKTKLHNRNFFSIFCPCVSHRWPFFYWKMHEANNRNWCFHRVFLKLRGIQEVLAIFITRFICKTAARKIPHEFLCRRVGFSDD